MPLWEDRLTDRVMFMCPNRCECDSKGPWIEQRLPCAHCDGTGIYNGGHLARRYANTKPGDKCPRCKGDGLGCIVGTASCSKCGSSAIDRSLFEAP